MAHERILRAYLSGAISSDTGEGREVKIAKFDLGERWLEKRGYAVVNPLKVEPCATGSCVERDGLPEPGQSQITTDTKVHSWNCFLRNDLRAMLECDEIWMLPFWFKSRGAELERMVADRVGMPVHYISAEQLRTV